MSDSAPEEVIVLTQRYYVPAWLRNLWSLIRQQPLLTSLVVIALIGVGISIYLTISHYEKVPPICTATGVINCANVLKSQFSTIPGTGKNGPPITFPGMLWFIVSGALALVALIRVWRGEPDSERLRLYHLLWAAAGMLFVLYLVYDEIVQLHAICEWCTGVHLLTLITLVITWYRFTNPNAGQVRPAPAASYRDYAPARRSNTASTHKAATLPRSMRSRSAQSRQGNRTPARTSGRQN